MTTITLDGNPVNTFGNLPAIGTQAPPFTLTKSDMADCTLADFSGKKIVMNIFPSIDTAVCAVSVRRFNAIASNLSNTVVLCISADLPFAQSRFCGAEGLNNVVTLSTFRHPEFGSIYGVGIIDGPLTGLMSRAVILLDHNNVVTYTEQVPEIAHEPDYDRALKMLQ